MPLVPEKLDHKPPRWGKRAAQAASVVGAVALTAAWPVLGTPVLAACAVVLIWVEAHGK